MALTAILVDRARWVGAVASGPRKMGTTPYETREGTWFRARLFLASSPQDVAAGRPRTLASPQLLYGIKDEDGEPIALDANDRVEVTSVELGDAMWQVTGDPEPIRKRRRVIGFQADLQRVEEHELA